jgi:hypothetical protein
MQTANSKYVFLAAILLVGAGVYAAVGETTDSGAPRWPQSDAVFSADSWVVGPLQVEHSSNNTDLVTRTFRNSSGATATLTLVANRAPKLYAAGADVPFLGNGYAVQPAAADIGTGDGVSALVAQKGSEQWLVAYAYGEQRGLLGNGPLAWTLAVTDGVLGRPNDYYKLYLSARTDGLGPGVDRQVVELARGLFPHIAGWYATAG